MSKQADSGSRQVDESIDTQAGKLNIQIHSVGGQTDRHL